MFNIIKRKSSEIVLMILIPVVALLLITSDINFSKSNQPEKTVVMSSVMRYVDKYYIDKSRISPYAMLDKGLLSLERIIDEVLIENKNKDNNKSIIVRVAGNHKEFNISDINTIEDVTEVFDNVFSFISSNYTPDEQSFSDIEFSVLDEMLNSLDSNSGIITPRIYKEFMIETKGSFGGLGIVIGIREGDLTVISPMEGTPAYEVGIKPQDKIIQIEEDSTVNMSLLEAVSRLRGPKGTNVTIYVTREGMAQPLKYSIKRGTIKIESVDAFKLEDNIVYLRIRDFQKNTLASIKDKLRKLSGNDIDTINGIILDLRGNPGGLLDQARKISDLFLQKGTIVSTKIGDSEKSFVASDEGFNYRGKIVVLVDSGSASASEIVAGALKNNDRAIVIGERSFGKGSVQQIFTLEKESALKLTIANYLTPGNLSIQDIGITPDIRLVPVNISRDNLKLTIAERKKKDKELKLEEPYYTIRYLNIKKENEDEELPEGAFSNEEKRKKIQDDFNVNFAKEILKTINAQPHRTLNLNKLKPEIDKISSREEANISDNLNKFGIDWSIGNSASFEKNDLLVKINKSVPVVTAGESIDIEVEVKNFGKHPLYRVTAVTESDNPALSGKEFVFGKIMPSGKSIWNNSFEIPKWYSSRQDLVKLNFYDHYDNQINQSEFELIIKEVPKPEFAYNYQIIDDGSNNTSGNNNGIPETGELIGIKLGLKNIGGSRSESTTLLLSDKNNESVNLKKGRLMIENLEPGVEKDGVFLFAVKKPLENFSLNLQIIDNTFRETLSDTINFDTKNIPVNTQNNKMPGEVMYKQQPHISVSEIPLISLSDKLVVNGVISDINGVDLVTIFVGEDKVYLNSGNAREKNINTSLELEKGINYITFIAKDATGLEARKTFVVRRDA